MSDAVQIALIGALTTLLPISAAGLWKIISNSIANVKKAAAEAARAEVSQAEAAATITALKDEVDELSTDLDEREATIDQQDAVIVSLTGSVAKYAEAFKELAHGKAVTR